MVKHIGKAYDDIPMSKLAKYIMTQLARRDIWVTNCKIFECKKQELNFKETKGGIILNRSKFKFDDIEDVEEVGEEPSFSPSYATMANRPIQQQPIKIEIFNPDKALANIVAQKYKLTINKKYQIYKEEIKGASVNGSTVPTYYYIIDNDVGERICIPSLHFVPPTVGLLGQPPEQQPRNNLLYQGMEQYDMPILRG